MNTLHLQYALEIARTGSISQAADNLYMGQPTLSKAIRELEESVGFSIFVRTSKGATPTEKGSRFLICARGILAQTEQIRLLAQDGAAEAQELTLALPGSCYVLEAFTAFAASLDPARRIRVRMRELGSMQTISELESGGAQVGMIRFRREYRKYFEDYLAQRQLTMEPVWELSYLLLLSQEHPLAQAEQVRQADLGGCIRIAHGDTAVPYLNPSARRVDHVSTSRTLYLPELAGQLAALAAVPTAYLWSSPVPEHWLRRFGLVQRVCADNEIRHLNMLVTPKGYRLTELERRFVDELYRQKNLVSFAEYR